MKIFDNFEIFPFLKISKILNFLKIIKIKIKYENIKISSTDTEKVPNTSASAASATTDINGAAIVNAINNIKSGLNEFIYDYFKTNSKIKYENNFVYFDKRKISFK